MTVFFDVDTQIDFLFPAGALFVPGTDRLIKRFAALNYWAASQHIPVISTVDAHSENDVEFRSWPHHCVVGTVGQGKPQRLLLDKRTTIASSAGAWDVDGVEQILLEKQTIDCFTNENLVPLLDKLQADRCVVYGVVTEICVEKAAFGLLNNGRQVEIVSDAIAHIDKDKAEAMLQAFQARGGKLVTASQVMG